MALERTSILAPFLIVPLFFYGMASLQDMVVDASGRSWLHAALLSGVPCGLFALASLAGAIRMLSREKVWMKTAIINVMTNALAFGIIIACVYFAATE
jgi:hypothetical protein